MKDEAQLRQMGTGFYRDLYAQEDCISPVVESYVARTLPG